jgi:hypothetical protein
MIFIAGAQAFASIFSQATYPRYLGAGASIADTIGWRVRALISLPETLTWNSIVGSEHIGETLAEETLIDFTYSDSDTEASDQELNLDGICVPVKEISSSIGVTLYGLLIDGINVNADSVVVLNFVGSLSNPTEVNPSIVGDR